jgi:hypothetical protein
MTDRRPLVIVNGLQQELPAGDGVAASVLPATAQFEGYTIANIAEIEAATKALRVTPRAFGDMTDSVLCCNRFAMGLQISHVATTTFLANSEVLTLMNLSANPVAIRRIGLSVATVALTGARVGLMRVCGMQMYACTSMYNHAFLFNPPVGQADNFGANVSGLKLRQNSPTLFIGCSQNSLAPNGVPGFTAVVSGGRTIGEVTGGAPAAVGTNVKPYWFFDSYGEEPFWLHPTMGLFINSTFPAAGTSQTIRYALSLVWDEWLPATPR